jgi:soluble lytic murein transglycosylase-like protein
MENSVRAERIGVRHGVEASGPSVGLRPVFRLRCATLNTNGIREFCIQLAGLHHRLRATVVIALLSSASALAGEQRYEPLAASVQAALHASIADRAAPTLVFATDQEGQAWLSSMSKRLAARVPDKQTRLDLLMSVQYEAKRAGLDPQMVLGVIDVESKFRKYAVSRAGARGYMQVMPFWVELIGTAEQNLFNLRTNLRYGCVILRHYLDIEHGDTYRALARYNGSLGKSDYAVKVMSSWQKRWIFPGEPATIIRVSKPGPIRYMGDAR